MQGPLNIPSGGKAVIGARGCSKEGSARASGSRMEVHKKQEAGRGVGAADSVHARAHSNAASFGKIARRNVGGSAGWYPGAGVRQDRADGWSTWIVTC